MRVARQANEQLEVGDPTRETARRNNLGLTKSSFNRIVKKELKLECYVPGKGITPAPGDAQRRLAMCHTIIPRPLAQRQMMVFGDEKWFTLNGMVNPQNMRLYGPRKSNGQGGKPEQHEESSPPHHPTRQRRS